MLRFRRPCNSSTIQRGMMQGLLQCSSDKMSKLDPLSVGEFSQGMTDYESELACIIMHLCTLLLILHESSQVQSSAGMAICKASMSSVLQKLQFAREPGPRSHGRVQSLIPIGNDLRDI